MAVVGLGWAVGEGLGLGYLEVELFEQTGGADYSHFSVAAVAADGEEVSVDGDGEFYADAAGFGVVEQGHAARLADLPEGGRVHGDLTAFVYADVRCSRRLYLSPRSCLSYFPIIGHGGNRPSAVGSGWCLVVASCQSSVVRAAHRILPTAH